MILLFVLSLIWAFGVVVYDLFFKKKKNVDNHYIKSHEKKLKDDRLYSKYMDWCFRHGEAPMDKKGFDLIRDKEKYINSFMRKY